LTDIGYRPSLVDLVWLLGLLVLLVVLPALAGALAWFYFYEGKAVTHRHRRAAHQMMAVAIAVVALLVAMPPARAQGGSAAIPSKIAP
jgi:hypothetical protein